MALSRSVHEAVPVKNANPGGNDCFRTVRSQHSITMGRPVWHHDELRMRWVCRTSREEMYREDPEGASPAAGRDQKRDGGGRPRGCHPRPSPDEPETPGDVCPLPSSTRRLLPTAGSPLRRADRQATVWLAQAYARSPQVTSDILAVQRASSFMKQASSAAGSARGKQGSSPSWVEPSPAPTPPGAHGGSFFSTVVSGEKRERVQAEPTVGHTKDFLGDLWFGFSRGLA